MNKEEEDYLINLYDELLNHYTLEELMSYSDWDVPELLAVLFDLEYLTLPEPLPV